MSKVYTQIVSNCWQCPNFGIHKGLNEVYSCYLNSEIQASQGDSTGFEKVPENCPLPTTSMSEKYILSPAIEIKIDSGHISESLAEGLKDIVAKSVKNFLEQEKDEEVFKRKIKIAIKLGEQDWMLAIAHNDSHY